MKCSMNNFKNVQFRGTFRDYQARVLSNANRHLSDGKVHIVAAPGSGKTILGLELIRGLNAPAIVLSPSVTIRQQWGERFEHSFIPEGENIEEYVSYDLKNPALITSVTYQALHAAWNKAQLNEDNEENSENEDFKSFDLMKTAAEAGIRTVCLDEAHHLRSEWQRALEGFIKKLGNNIILISLTATPPYDSDAGEWKRYHDLCGDIDEEIFVPDLVFQKTLCPHQDYLMFSYPTRQELNLINDRKQKVINCINSEFKGGTFLNALNSSKIQFDFNEYEDVIYERLDDFISLFKAAHLSGAVLSPPIERLVREYGDNSKLNNNDIKRSMQLIIDKPEIFTKEISDSLRERLKKNLMIDRDKVCLESNESIEKLLISSIGKLKSINTIVAAELDNLGEKLRMLILTDYIKKDLIGIIGSDSEINSMGTVPIFESVRRSCGARLALLSGTLVILPEVIMDGIKEIADGTGVSFSTSPIGSTGYCRVNFSGSNKNKVSIITEAFGRGLFQILVGTKSLLGEGWDSPCINSLILASFVGSFMLSNQMRGRAIRTDRNDPGKASNIWHLVTLDPNADPKELSGADFETVKRRFDSFMAPAYHSNTIENGIERLDILNPPFTQENIAKINARTLALARDRETMKSRWNAPYNNMSNRKPEVAEAAEISTVPLCFSDKLKNSAIIWTIIFASIFLLISIMFFIPLPVRIVMNLILAAVGIPVLIFKFRKAALVSSPLGTTRLVANAVTDTLKRMGIIRSKRASVEVFKNSYDERICVLLSGAESREQTIFSQAMLELFSPIDNPRYVLMNDDNGVKSFSVPSVIGNKKENAECLAAVLNNTAKNFRVVYTRNERGRRELLKCRKNSVIGKTSSSKNKRVFR